MEKVLSDYIPLREPFWKERAFGINKQQFYDNDIVQTRCSFKNKAGQLVFPYLYAIESKVVLDRLSSGRYKEQFRKGVTLIIIPIVDWKIIKEESDAKTINSQGLLRKEENGTGQAEQEDTNNTQEGEMKMDWSKETKGEFMTYPEGTYQVRIVGFEYTTASTGTQQVRWRAEIIQPEEFRGKTILDHTALTEKALWRIAKLVAACGVDTSAVGVMETETKAFNKVLNACKERRTYWHVREEVGQNGKPRNVVVDYELDPLQEKVVPSDEDDIAWKE